MKRIVFVLPVVAMTALGGCVFIGPTESRSYNNTGFDSVSASSGINVVLSQGPFAVNAQAPEGNLDKILVEQNGSELKLSRKSEMSWFGGNGHYVVNVTAPGVTSISASGGADVDSSALQAETLSLSASGGGDIALKGLKITMPGHAARPRSPPPAAATSMAAISIVPMSLLRRQAAATSTCARARAQMAMRPAAATSASSARQQRSRRTRLPAAM
ncbi:MAG: DUF2807 domain-containing protein [Hyphomonadaceae bacterium]